MENIIKVDKAMKSIKQELLKTDDAEIIKECKDLCDYFAAIFYGFLADISILEKYAQFPLIPDSDLKRIDDLVAKIFLKHIRLSKKTR